jgi:holo-[acyl-carrier protein] synthase
VVLGTGVDIIAVKDVSRELTRGQWESSDGIFRSSELERINGRRRSARMLAVCFAIKEATLKALGVHVHDLRTFTEIEVAQDSAGAPQVVLHGAAAEKANSIGVMRVVSASHVDRRVAAAMVILEG